MRPILISFLLLSCLIVQAQTYMTQTGTIAFFSEAALENIEATNNQVSSVLDLSTGQMEAQALIKAFSFDKALMQQHFNERYLESHTYPKSVFKGQINNIDAVNLDAGAQEVDLNGQLTLHGVTKDIQVKATLRKSGDDQINGTSTFFVKPADFDIRIPSGVRNKVAKEIKVTINLDLEPLS